MQESKYALESLDRRLLMSAVVRTFQDGLDGYAGTEDTYVYQYEPTVAFGTQSKAQVDADVRGSIDGNQPAQGLLRFRDVFGDGAGQVPIGAAVTSASLSIVVGSSSSDNSNHSTSFYRMLAEWDESSTWDGLVNGVSADGVEAAASADGTVKPATLGATLTINVTAALQAWAASPAANAGWALISAGTDGWWWNSAEATDPAKRPKLSVTFDGIAEPPVNQAPTVDAGPDRAITEPDAASLDGTVNDDALPEPHAVTTLWEQVSGPGTATFADAAAVDTTATFSSPGTYVLKLTASDGELSSSDQVTVVVAAKPVNQAPTVDAGPNRTVTQPNAASLDGTVTDDQLPEPPSVSTLWEQVSGPGTATFADAAAIDTTATFSLPGTYVLKLTASDGELSSSDQVTVVVAAKPANQAPTVDAGPNRTVTQPNAASLDGTVTDDQLPEPPNVSTLWQKVSGPGTTTFGNATAIDTTATFSAPGTYVLRLTASDGALSASDDVTVVVQEQLPPPPPPTDIVPLASLALSADTGEKPQSKVWQHGGSWWSVLATGSGAWLMRLDGTKWTQILKLSTTTGMKADVLPSGNLAHVLLVKGTSTTRLASLEFVPGANGAPGTYKMWSRRPSLATVPLESGVETATIALDGDGRMWVAFDASSTIRVRYSDDTYSSWSSAITLASGTSSDDISAITAFPNGSVGVMWSNQATKRFGFRTHAAGASASSWTSNEVPASQSALSVGNGMADDHLNMTVASDGTLYAAVKTSYDTDGRPAVALLVRRPNGQWDNLYAVDSTGYTRPIVVINEAANSLRVIYTFNNDSGPGDIVYRESPLSAINFGPRVALMKDVFNNASTAHRVGGNDLVVIAADSSQRLGGVRFAWSAQPAATSVFNDMEVVAVG